MMSWQLYRNKTFLSSYNWRVLFCLSVTVDQITTVREKELNITAPNRMAAFSYVSLKSYCKCSTQGWRRAIGRNFSVVCFA